MCMCERHWYLYWCPLVTIMLRQLYINQNTVTLLSLLKLKTCLEKL